MLRDDQIASIKDYLDKLIKDENESLKYEAIISMANHKMNLKVFIDEEGKHQILWYNNHISHTTFDKDIDDLLNYIKKLCHNIS